MDAPRNTAVVVVGGDGVRGAFLFGPADLKVNKSENACVCVCVLLRVTHCWSFSFLLLSRHAPCSRRCRAGFPCGFWRWPRLLLSLLFKLFRLVGCCCRARGMRVKSPTTNLFLDRSAVKLHAYLPRQRERERDSLATSWTQAQRNQVHAPLPHGWNVLILTEFTTTCIRT